MTPVAELKLAHRATWAAGDYAAVARHIDDVPPRDLLSRMDIQPGHEVLDVATGTGNLAIRAAAAGAQVVGLDLTPELFETARARAAAAGVAVDWVEGDAEELPYEDESFDRVAVGLRRAVRAAPRDRRPRAGRRHPPGRAHRARQLDARGPDRRAVQDHGQLHAGPAGVRLPAAAVGQPDTCAACSRARRVELDFERGHNPWRFESAEAWVSFMETAYGPTVKARERLTGEGRWQDCRAEMLALAERHNVATDGSLLMQAEYLITIGHKVG